MSQFLEHREKHKLELNDIVAIMTDLLLGGVDTVCNLKVYFYSHNYLNNYYLKTSTSLHYFLYEMGKNQDVQERLNQEINSVLKLNEPITEEHISKLKYLKYSVKESLR